MLRRVEEVFGFIHRNRAKVAVGTAAAVTIGVCAAVAYLAYNTSSNETDIPVMENILNDKEDDDGNIKKKSTLRKTKSSQSNGLGKHVIRLVRINEEYETTLNKFIPILHLKIVNIVDMSGTIKQLRSGRSGDMTSNDSTVIATEDDLWDEIKVASFSLVYITAYALCALTILLRIHIHLFSAAAMVHHDGSGQLDLNRLLELTYSHFFESGIQHLLDAVQPIIRERLSVWKVKDKLKVEYAELVRMMNDIRNGIDSYGVTTHLKAMLIPPSEELSVDPADLAVNRLVLQTWDIVESPVFASLVSASVGSCFQKVYSLLQRHVFFSEHPMSTTESRALPLASLLPQLKPVALRFIPKEGAHVTALAREVTVSSAIDNFCLSLLDIQ